QLDPAGGTVDEVAARFQRVDDRVGRLLGVRDANGATQGDQGEGNGGDGFHEPAHGRYSYGEFGLRFIVRSGSKNKAGIPATGARSGTSVDSLAVAAALPCRGGRGTRWPPMAGRHGRQWLDDRAAWPPLAPPSAHAP